MNKSKFLKKSLALLLAFMLVFAMIPLGASAVAPTLHQVDVVVNGVNTRLDISGNEITGEISETAQSFGLNFLVTGDVGSVTYTKQDDTGTPQGSATPNGSIWQITGLAPKQYEVDGKYVVKVKLVNGSEENDYTVTLTPVANPSDTSVTALTVWTNSGVLNAKDVPQLGDTEIDGTEIKITVPYDTKTVKVRDITLPAGAEMKLGATTVVRDTELVSTWTAGASEMKVNVTVTAGNMNTNYTIVLTKATGFKSFGTTNSLDTVIFPGENKIAVLLPYGYTAGKQVGENFDLIPEFELDYPSATAYWNWTSSSNPGTELTSGETKVSASYDQVTLDFQNYKGDDAKSWATLKKETTWADFNKVRFGTSSGTVTIVYAEGTYRTYDVFFGETGENNEAIISELTIGTEEAVIDQEKKTIDITLPNGTDKSKIAASAITLKASNEATITTPMLTGGSDATFVDSTDDRKVTETFTVAKTLNASQPVSIRVVSEDGLTKNDYTLNVNVSNNYQPPRLTVMSLVDPDGVRYDVQIPDNQTKIVFNVPYRYKVKADLEGWKIYYTKTVGAEVTVLPKNGSTLGSSEAYIPAQFGPLNSAATPSNSGADIAVRAYNPSKDSMDETVYNIVINRKNASQVATLANFAMVGTDNYDDVEDDITYPGSINSANEITVSLPWSHYQQTADILNILRVLKDKTATTDPNAKLYYYHSSTNGTLRDLDNIANAAAVYCSSENDGTPLTGAGHAKADNNPYVFVVLSEQAWVDSNPTSNGLITRWDNNTLAPNLYQTYNLYIERADAKTSKDLKNLALANSKGAIQTLSVDMANDVIKATIPYGFTTPKTVIDAGNAANFNKITLTYDMSQRAWVLGDDNDKNIGDLADTDATTSLPTSDAGVFGGRHPQTGAQLVIERETGDVYLLKYDDDSKVTTVRTNKLAVTNEKGDINRDVYTFKLDVAKPNTDSKFTSFSINGNIGRIDDAEGTIEVTMPFGSEITYLKPTFTVSSGAYVKEYNYADGAVNAWNFSTPRQFTVKAEDEVHETTYTVTVKVSDEFTDVPKTAWYYEEVMKAVRLGLITGKGNGIFAPMEDVKRGDFALMIARMENGGEEGWDKVKSNYATSEFVDVAEGKWYSEAITYCVQKGYVSGTGNNNFSPDRAIKREEMAKFLCNVAGLKEVTSPSAKFADDASISNWAKGFVYAASEAGLMNGVGGNKFAPKSTTPRCQAAAALVRYTESK